MLISYKGPGGEVDDDLWWLIPLCIAEELDKMAQDPVQPWESTITEKIEQ